MLITGIFLSTNISQAQVTLEVGSTWYYYGTWEDTIKYKGEIYTSKGEGVVTFEILALDGDRVHFRTFYGGSHYSGGWGSLLIWDEENYNPISLYFPGYFMDPDSFDFFNSKWPYFYEHYEDEFNVKVTAEDGSFSATMTNSSYRKRFGTNETEYAYYTYPYSETYYVYTWQVGFYDVGEYSFSEEYTFNEYGILIKERVNFTL